MSFSEWLRETEKEKTQIKEHKYYTEEQLLKDIELYESTQKMTSAHNISLELRHNINLTDRMIILNENIIEPNKIHISSNDLEKLNTKFNKFNIFFSKGNELSAVYKQEKDEIEVFISSQDKPIEIEAMLAHEMVHKEQNKRSSNNYFKQSEKIINSLNLLLDKKQKLISEPGGILIHRDKIKELENDIKEKYLVFTHLNPFEEMAYACQYVKEYKNLKPQEILDKMREDKIKINNCTKKYVAMYWLIKDKI